MCVQQICIVVACILVAAVEITDEEAEAVFNLKDAFELLKKKLDIH